MSDRDSYTSHKVASGEGSSDHQPPADGIRGTSLTEKLIALAFGAVFLVLFAIFAINGADQEINADRLFIIRQILAIGGAAFAAIVPGFLSVSARTGQGVVVRAGGAIGIFLILVFLPVPVPKNVQTLQVRVNELDLELANLQAAVTVRDLTQLDDQIRRAKTNTVALKKELSRVTVECEQSKPTQ